MWISRQASLLLSLYLASEKTPRWWNPPALGLEAFDRGAVMVIGERACMSSGRVVAPLEICAILSCIPHYTKRYPTLFVMLLA